MAVHTDGCKKSMCRVNVTVFASSGYSCDVDEIQSHTQGDEVRSCHAHRKEKLAVVVCLVRRSVGQQERLVFNAWFLSRNHDTKNLARRKTRCDFDSSSFWKFETKSKIDLVQNKSYTSRDSKWQSFSDFL